ncbi:hypothetical protein J5N97_013980 [Dioscorea zingiberensis]|uniref:non-specific serine/threonine protein kinase n=1 Tax=Dioscorea zingiberensis TaxID=325984 RepID=A0A9D5CRS5_9LILI|nr:hypothetical protein J5N97_013980 [Dioscorea zingiberensis]
MPSTKPFLSEAILAILICCFLQPAIAQVTDPFEVDALKNIWSSLIDPKGNLNNWKSGDPCTSNWTGVICYNTTSRDGYLHIKELQLLKMNLSGNLVPELGHLSHLKILDFMWNQINGSIPKEIGNITTLELLLLNGNNLTGSLPEELGNLPNLDRIQIDQNHISGQLPKSFANLNKTKHFHMNNNSISGQIPRELSRLPSLVHFLLDNNNLSGHIPPEFSQLPKLLILQLDNNNFSGSSIPDSFGNISTLLKLSLRNCSLQGPIPDLSKVPKLGYLDLSWNQLTGSIPSNKLSDNITTMDFQNNNLTTISDTLNPPANVSIWLYRNPVCSNASQLNILQLCRPETNEQRNSSNVDNVDINCGPCPTVDYEYNPLSPFSCFCSVPLHVWICSVEESGIFQF